MANHVLAIYSKQVLLSLVREVFLNVSHNYPDLATFAKPASCLNTAQLMLPSSKCICLILAASQVRLAKKLAVLGRVSKARH